MVISEIITLVIYAVSMVFLHEYFGKHDSPIPLVICSIDNAPQDLSFVMSVRFTWKVAVIVAVSALPLYVIKLIKSRVAPAASSKLL
jgi:phospholipid-translocating ATPase